MASLTDVAEGRVLAWLLGEDDPAPVGPVLPLEVALMTANGDDSTAGTEVAGGTYARQELSVDRTEGAAETGQVLRFEGIPTETTVVGVEIWDSADPAVRWWHEELDEPKQVDDGVLEIPAGDLTMAVD